MCVFMLTWAYMVVCSHMCVCVCMCEREYVSGCVCVHKCIVYECAHVKCFYMKPYRPIFTSKSQVTKALTSTCKDNIGLTSV